MSEILGGTFIGMVLSLIIVFIYHVGYYNAEADYVDDPTHFAHICDKDVAKHGS